MLEIISGAIVVAAIGGFAAAVGGAIFEIVRAWGDPDRRAAIRHRSFRENVRQMLG